MNRRMFTCLLGANALWVFGCATGMSGQTTDTSPTNTEQELWQRVVLIVREQLLLPQDIVTITPGKRFVEDLGADSLDTVELIMAAEEEFGIEIPESVVEKLTTIGAAYDYLKPRVLK